MYDLYIANKNYSSWSLRPWVLMRELGIEFREHWLPFGQESKWREYRKISPSGQGSLPGGRRYRGLGFVGHRRIPGGATALPFGRPRPAPGRGRAARLRRCTRASANCATAVR